MKFNNFDNETNYDLDETSCDLDNSKAPELNLEEVLAENINKIIRSNNYDTTNPVIAALMAVRQAYETAEIAGMEM